MSLDDSQGSEGPLPVLKNFRFEDIVGENIGSAGEFTCLKDSPCTNITLKDVRIQSRSGFVCSHAKVVDSFEWCSSDRDRPPMSLQNPAWNKQSSRPSDFSFGLNMSSVQEWKHWFNKILYTNPSKFYLLSIEISDYFPLVRQAWNLYSFKCFDLVCENLGFVREGMKNQRNSINCS